MGNGLPQPETARRNDNFCFAHYHIWLRGFMVGSKRVTEVSLPGATKKNQLYFWSANPQFRRRRAFVVGGNMSSEAKQPEVTKRSKHFWFVNSHLRWPGIAIGSTMSNEVTPIEASKRRIFFSCEALCCEALCPPNEQILVVFLFLREHFWVISQNWLQRWMPLLNRQQSRGRLALSGKSGLISCEEPSRYCCPLHAFYCSLHTWLFIRMWYFSFQIWLFKRDFSAYVFPQNIGFL